MASKLIAIIAGVGAGTGAAVARKFAATYPVVLLARNPENFEGLAKEINASGGKATFRTRKVLRVLSRPSRKSSDLMLELRYFLSYDYPKSWSTCSSSSTYIFIGRNFQRQRRFPTQTLPRAPRRSFRHIPQRQREWRLPVLSSNASTASQGRGTEVSAPTVSHFHWCNSLSESQCAHGFFRNRKVGSTSIESVSRKGVWSSRRACLSRHY
jgi:hypothetical protein